MDFPQVSNLDSHTSANACGITLGIFNDANMVSYGGGVDIFQKKRHLGSAPWPVISRGRSDGVSFSIMWRQDSSDAHFGLSVPSRVTPT
jgi:hypothetical protein